MLRSLHLLRLRTGGKFPRVLRLLKRVRDVAQRSVGRAVGAFEAGLCRLRMLADGGRLPTQPNAQDAVVQADHARPSRPGLPVAGLTIVLDGCAFEFGGGGIKRLWTAVMEEWSRDGFARSVVVLDRGGTAPRYPGFRYRSFPRLRAHDTLSQRALLQHACVSEGADMFVSTCYTHPSRCQSLLYVYDMTPEVLGWNLRLPEWREKRAAIAHASAYAVLSESTLRDMNRLSPESRGKPVSLAYPAADPVFQRASESDARNLVARLNLPSRYVIFMGHREGYKNATLLFQALAQLEDHDRPGVLLVGGRSVLEPHLALTAPEASVRIANLSDEDLRFAYSGAAALVYVSRYEGFGLPILEAMACGCPVVTCRNSSLPEAAGPSAMYVDDSDPTDLANALRGLVRGDAKESAAHRIEWAATFSWA